MSPAVKSLAPSSHWSSQRCWKLLIGTPKAISVAAWTNPGLSVSSHKGECSSPQASEWPSAKLALVYICLLYWGAPNGTQHCRSSLRSAEWREMNTLLHLWLFFESYSPQCCWLSLLPGCTSGSCSLPVCQHSQHLFSKAVLPCQAQPAPLQGAIPAQVQDLVLGLLQDVSKTKLCESGSIISPRLQSKLYCPI